MSLTTCLFVSLTTCLLLACLAARREPDAGDYFRITVVDAESGRGVPLVELTTTNQIRHVTDSNGVVAFYEPGLIDQKVFFHVTSHGYEFPQDGFGFRGKALDVRAGGSATLEIKRINIARRLYRVTGAGIYRDSVLTGLAAPIDQPLLNAQVFGSDSVVNAVFRGRLHWFWGDTLRPSYPLGNFHVPGATSRLPAAGGLDPAVGVNLEYFTDAEGFAKPTCDMPGEGPTWIDGLIVLKDDDGRERMFAAYLKVRGQLDVYARGLAEFNDKRHEFEQVVEFDMRSPVFPSGHPFLHSVHGVDYIYFADPAPLVRVGADVASLADLSQYQAYTCLVAGSRLETDSPHSAQLDRAADGTLQWDWKRDTPVLTPTLQSQLLKATRFKPGEAIVDLEDPDSGRHAVAHRGSVYWNAFRRRWIMIATEAGGTSPLGEVWYSEADAPEGPWRYARKVLTHDRYSFYNPKQHPYFDQDGGRLIYFEGTYTHTFSGNPAQTPRYDYNQVLYQLDLADERLKLPE
ncbi:MAG TPA: hypothetical protein VGX78_03415 [Pirellulales bacterium]|nr:hypothetical protein [Pirellulales bacterium]